MVEEGRLVPDAVIGVPVGLSVRLNQNREAFMRAHSMPIVALGSK